MSRDKDAVARELLALRCRRGDRAALEELIHTWERPLLYYLRRLVRDEADAWDVLQKTWVRVLKGDSRLVVHAAAQAQRAADLILGTAAE